MTRMKQVLTALVATAVLAFSAANVMADGAKIFVIGGKPDDPF